MLAILAAALVLSLPAAAQAKAPAPAQAPAATVATPAPATAESSQRSERLADKLAQPFLRLAPWHVDLAAAQRAAAREGKLLFVHCTRSFTPCGTSIACERGVLSSPQFREFSQRVVLYCHVTAHLDPDADRFLALTRGSGWPHHVVMDAAGRVLGVHESHREKSVAEFARMLTAAEDYLRLDAECARAIEAQQRRRLEAGLAAGALDLPTARALFASCGTLEPADAERLGGAITDLEVAAVLAGIDRFDTATRPQIGALFHTMSRAGKRPVARNAMRDFWGGILLYLETLERPDLALYAEGLAQLSNTFGELRGYREFLDERQKKFDELQRKVAQTSTPQK